MKSQGPTITDQELVTMAETAYKLVQRGTFRVKLTTDEDKIIYVYLIPEGAEDDSKRSDKVS